MDSAGGGGWREVFSEPRGDVGLRCKVAGKLQCWKLSLCSAVQTFLYMECSLRHCTRCTATHCIAYSLVLRVVKQAVHCTATPDLHTGIASRWDRSNWPILVATAR